MNNPISPRQLEILRSLNSKLNIKKIAEYDDVSRISIYKVIKKLVERGLVKKIEKGILKNHKGRRGYYLTREGNNVLKKMGIKPLKLKIERFCEVCGFHLVVNTHHIDENRQNNHEKNLINLCPNHHYLIHYGNAKIEDIGGKRVYSIILNEVEVIDGEGRSKNQ